MAKKQVKVPTKKTAKKPASKKGNNNHINTLEIKNFKSIKNMKIEPKRINIFIGRPNVGKSNILEAISLLGSSISIFQQPFLSNLVRYETFDNLFYDRDTEQKVEVASNLGFCLISREERNSWYNFIVSERVEKLPEVRKYDDVNQFTKFIKDENGVVSKNAIASYYLHVANTGNTSGTHSPGARENVVRKYDFQKRISFDNLFNSYLNPPFGDNQYAVIRKHKNLHKEIANLFTQQKLKFIIKNESNVIELQKQSQGIGVSFPYSGIADTLQRFIFYLLAIKTNKKSVLLFEEPEVHSHPAYIRQIAEDIIADENDNQFFITTHSPFILNIILENAKASDVAVFKTKYDKYQTSVELLSEKEIANMLNYGSDIFFQV
jgi:AAA15 family ATPase/GTPase